MRDDMPKKFMEPGGGKKGKFPRGSKKLKMNEEGDSATDGRSMNKVHSDYRGRGVGTDFSVMRRFLNRRKGRPWDDVYSEICQHADYRAFDGHHLREWISYLVELNCYEENGQIYNEHGHAMDRWWNRHQFYVHPITKTLEHVEVQEPKPKKAEPAIYELDGVLFHKHDGIWYRIKFKKMPYTRLNRWRKIYHYSEATDAFVKDWFPNKDLSLYYHFDEVFKRKYGLDEDGEIRYCYWKQAANHREIKHLKSKYKIN